jgi:hypothetical protein
MTVTVLGVRHHGPGSARAVRAALDELQPDAVLIEGPPEADEVALLAADPEMRPPVALLVYSPDAPDRASFYPLAVFSPEWVAIRHAVAHEVPLRFIDLPATHALAEQPPETAVEAGPDADNAAEPDTADEAGPDTAQETRPASADPIGTLARTAGHDDPERWWEDVVEHRDGSALELFAAIAEAMGALREEADELTPREARREAAMRRAIRRAEKDGHERIAVICGAWHAPVLARDTFPPASHDDALLRGLPKVKVAATWVPWTNDRLSFASGYGAGVTSPGWYHHLFTATDRPVARWLQRTAALLREENLDASPASVVEAIRLTQALGAVRSRPLPGLTELTDATLAVLCHGNTLPLALIERRLVIGEVLGAVPEATPMVPLMEDLARLQRTLRMPAEASARDRELDLRKDFDLRRSHLLHRLDLLGIPWGVRPRATAAGTMGTFKEAWQLTWQPEFAVRLIEASRYGATVESAAAAFAVEEARSTADLPRLTALVEVCLLAALPNAVASLMTLLADRAATDADIGRLMAALEPLARVHRYGSVRREDTTAVQAVVDGLVTRICVGLPGAVGSLDDDAAAQMVAHIESVDAALAIIDTPEQIQPWRASLASISTRPDLHGRVAGRVTRLLLDAGAMSAEEARRRMEFELSRAADADRGAAWLEGFLAGSGLLLLHDRELLAIVDAWIRAVPQHRFDDLLPIVRRGFAPLAAGERRQLGSAVKTFAPGGAPTAPVGGDDDVPIDLARADAALATVLEFLG